MAKHTSAEIGSYLDNNKMDTEPFMILEMLWYIHEKLDNMNSGNSGNVRDINNGS